MKKNYITPAISFHLLKMKVKLMNYSVNDYTGSKKRERTLGSTED